MKKEIIDTSCLTHTKREMQGSYRMGPGTGERCFSKKNAKRHESCYADCASGEEQKSQRCRHAGFLSEGGSA